MREMRAAPNVVYRDVELSCRTVEVERAMI